MIILTGDRYKSRPNILSKEEIHLPRSDHSSTSDSESARLQPAISDRLSSPEKNGGEGRLLGGERPPARGEVRLATQGQPMSR